ncbi:hypothetical protein HDU76_008310 [Blyttiomyces sp. JEL0837]|nr:hypothetical protein HDU76_008310 [Blyttiomyces sp. JEL0837]
MTLTLDSLVSTTTITTAAPTIVSPRFILNLNAATSTSTSTCTTNNTTTAVETALSALHFGTDTETELPVVFKSIKNQELAKEEIRLLKMVKEHQVPYTIQFLDIVSAKSLGIVGDGQGEEQQVADYDVIVMPCLEKLPSRITELANASLMCRQLVSALASIHKLNMAHLDVTLCNLMKNTTTGDLVLIDFGLARICEPTTCHPPGRGTPGHVAPEVMSGTGSTPIADMYSAGIVLGQWLEPFLPDFSLQYLGSRLVTVSTTNFIVGKLRDALDRYERCHRSTGSGFSSGGLGGSSYSLDSCYDYDEDANSAAAECMEDPMIRAAADLLCRMLESDCEKRISAREALEHEFLCSGVGAFAGERCKVSGSRILFCGTPKKRRAHVVIYR